MQIKKDHLNFAVGPVMMSDEIMKLGADPVPYFRTKDFSALMLENAAYLKKEMDKIGWDAWLEPMSNTVYFKAPSRAVAEKFDLAPDWDDRLGGALAHIVVMQHVTKELLDILLAELSK